MARMEEMTAGSMRSSWEEEPDGRAGGIEGQHRSGEGPPQADVAQTGIAQAGAARAAIRDLLNGKPPNGVTAAELGAWSETYAALVQAHRVDGPAGVRTAFRTLVAADPNLGRLIAGSESRTWGLRLLPADALDTLPPVRHLDANHEIPTESLVSLYGASGAGKTFVALDYAARTAQAAPVVYIAGEGAVGLAARKLAWCRHHQLGAGELFFVPQAVNLLDGAQVDALIGLIAPLHPALLIVDTLARCMIGGDENSASDMGLFVTACDEIKVATGATVLIVHHTGKTGTLERGSSALRAACDQMIGLSNDDGLITLSCEKSKDSAPFTTRTLSLLPVETGRTGEEGLPETSCVLEPGDCVPVTGAISPSKRKILEALSQETFRTAGAKSAVLAEVTGVKGSHLYKTLSTLMRKGYVRQNERGDPFYLTDAGEEAMA